MINTVGVVAVTLPFSTRLMVLGLMIRYSMVIGNSPLTVTVMTADAPGLIVGALTDTILVNFGMPK